MKKTKQGKLIGRPPIWPFSESIIGVVIKPLLFTTRARAVSVRCAAHTMAHKYDWQFSTKIRETDVGKFELTVVRVK
jgi:hypothetical protein